jgi:hypothetical protein
MNGSADWTHTQKLSLPCRLPFLSRCINDLIDSCGEVWFNTAYIFIGFRRAVMEIIPSVK